MNSKPYDVIVALDACVDILLYGDVVPRFGQAEQIVDDMDVQMGGSAAIFACQCAKLGLRTMGIGRVGADAFGDLFRSALADAGVDARRVEIDPSRKTGAGVALCANGDRAILTYLGSIDSLTSADIGEDALSQARHLHIASPFLMRRLRPDLPNIARRARALGLTVSLDTNWDPEDAFEGTRDLLTHCDVFLPNERELAAITGIDDVERALRVAAEWVPHVALKLGEKGARYAGIWGEAMAPAHATAIADAVGAGDSFDGGFVWAFLAGMGPRDCLRAGCAAGSLSTRRAGGTRGQGTLDDMQGLMAEARGCPEMAMDHMPTHIPSTERR